MGQRAVTVADPMVNAECTWSGRDSTAVEPAPCGLESTRCAARDRDHAAGPPFMCRHQRRRSSTAAVRGPGRRTGRAPSSRVGSICADSCVGSSRRAPPTWSPAQPAFLRTHPESSLRGHIVHGATIIRTLRCPHARCWPSLGSATAGICVAWVSVEIARLVESGFGNQASVNSDGL